MRKVHCLEMRRKKGGDVNTANTDDGGQKYAQTDMLHVLLNLEPR